MKTPRTFLEAKIFLEPCGSEHIHISGFEVMGPWRLFLPLQNRNVHLGWFESSWVLCHPGGLGTDQFHWGWLLGTLIGLDGEGP